MKSNFQHNGYASYGLAKYSSSFVAMSNATAALCFAEHSLEQHNLHGSREIDKLICILNALLKKVQELRACTEGCQVRNKHVSNFVAYPTKRRSQKHKILHILAS